MAKTVIVANRLHTPLMLQLRAESPDPQLRVVIKEVRINGCAVDVAPFVREDGVGLTEVEAEFWDAWEKWAMEVQFQPYMDGNIFAANTASSVKSMARERQDQMTGLEGLRVPLNENETVKPDPRLAEFRSASLTAAGM